MQQEFLPFPFGPTGKCKIPLVLNCGWSSSDDLSFSTKSFALHCPRPSLTTLSVEAMCLICSLIRDVSFWIVAPVLAGPRPPSLWLAYRVVDLEWNPPCMGRNFCVLTSVECKIFSPHLDFFFFLSKGQFD